MDRLGAQCIEAIRSGKSGAPSRRALFSRRCRQGVAIDSRLAMPGLAEQVMKKHALSAIVFALSSVIAAPALPHDCRVKDGYLRGAYEGDCDDSETAHGHGEAKGANTYVGEFVNGWPEGKGTYTWENGARLEGTFKRGRADGPGVYVSAKGVRYEGRFVDGKLDGLKPQDCPGTQGPVTC
jgi:hypothetical protein